MKKLIKTIIAGAPIQEALKKYKVSQTTYYRWLNGHRLFREYFRRYAHKIRENSEMRLDGNLGRAIRVVEETLGSRDPYLAYNAAEKLLTGRGKYRRSTDIQKDVKSTIQVQEAIDVSHHLDSNTTKLFIEALLGQAKGIQAPAEHLKIIDVKVLKELPPPQGASEEEQQAKTG
jgi:transcription termination factor NusB